jgi:hypothetical protein
MTSGIKTPNSFSRDPYDVTVDPYIDKILNMDLLAPISKEEFDNALLKIQEKDEIIKDCAFEINWATYYISEKDSAALLEIMSRSFIMDSTAVGITGTFLKSAASNIKIRRLPDNFINKTRAANLLGIGTNESNT